MKSTFDKPKDPIKDLMVLVFEKAGRESNEKTGYGLAKYLEKGLEERIKERTLIRYFDGYVLNKIGERKKPNKFNLNVLSEYVGFKDYKEYLRKGFVESERKKYKKYLLISLLVNIVLLGGLIFYISYYYKKNCMVWLEDHYEKVRCSNLTYEIALDKVVLERMRKIYPCDSSTFFKDGRPVVWYNRSIHQISYFTHHGLHPTNGKALKPITKAIIEAYMKPCDSL